MMFEHVVAYVDPGTGTLLLQIIASAIAGGAFFFRDRLFRLFRALRRG
jgi:hypothetical protein